MFNDFSLSLAFSQSTHMDVSIKAEVNRPVGSDQSFPGDRTGGQGFEDLDKDDIRRLDDVRYVDQRPFVWRRVIGYRS